MKYYILFNPLSGNETAEKQMESLSIDKSAESVYYNVLDDQSYKDLFSNITSEDKIILCGGDGTLNRFVNNTADLEINNEILFFATGSGNDFLNDLGIHKATKPIVINEYIKDLPIVTINGKDYRFLNGVGIGIDGFICAEGNRLRAKNNKKINYTMVALKALLFQYKPLNAKVTVDRITKEYKKVWLVPSMKGKYFGGGMKVAPMQDRTSENSEITSIVAHDLSKLRILTIFPRIFKGTHVKFTKYLEIKKCHEIRVEFDRPCDLQIDGEPIPDVKEYTLTTKKKAISVN